MDGSSRLHVDRPEAEEHIDGAALRSKGAGAGCESCAHELKRTTTSARERVIDSKRLVP